MSDPCELQALQYSQQIPEARRAEFLMAYQTQKKNRTTAFLLSFFLGFWGADRLYLGQTGIALLKIFTCGGAMIWALIDIFIIMGATDAHNRGLLQKLMTIFPAQPQIPPASYGYGAPPSNVQGYGPPPGAPVGYGPPR